MAITQEKLNIILMRDSGESRRMRIRRSIFRYVVMFFLLCPVLAAAAGTAIYYLWEERTKLQLHIAELEEINYKNQANSKRLSHLEALLNRQKDVQKNLSQNMAAKNVQKVTAQQKAGEKNGKKNSSDKNSGPEDIEGPGHADFPVLDTKEIIVQNVTNLLSAKRRLRTSFDLHNEGKESKAGEVVCILSLASGKTVRLVPQPADAGKYKISRFKKAVILTQIEPEVDMSNAQLILEIKNEAGKEIFRNVYPISQ